MRSAASRGILRSSSAGAARKRANASSNSAHPVSPGGVTPGARLFVIRRFAVDGLREAGVSFLVRRTVIITKYTRGSAGRGCASTLSGVA